MSDLPPMLKMMGVQEAIDAVVASANRAHPGWSEDAFEVLRRFITSGAIFKAEDVRNFAATTELPEPPDRRAWGGILQRASKAGLIVRIGYAPCRNKGAHNRPTTLWQAK